MTVNVEDFKKALQHWASGVAVVTTYSEKLGVQGMTVTAFTSVSVEPPQILVCLNQRADTREGIEECQHFAVNVLNAAQQDVSNQFAGGSSQQERFANTPWQMGLSGVPILTESLMSLECRVVDKILSGTHWIVIGEVHYSVCRSGEPVLYYRGDYRQLAEA
ncbi:MAG: flavin reductase family protein [Methylovulum sp.]|uniref:flavin reductase family protein n=1 Tax=Methylovulum sp. TaxID=1916980 RepID=UPI00260E5EBB|nr:flavin reductase family protein [Methylovulum sp.]MDD2725336.1 flavin reductase family protein [Methylovulum sp.]MDD5124839.1 flavin reductase family protein [Methylovulum sp.]